jgi:hypothetical protein
VWHGFDPSIQRDLANLRKLVQLSHQSPTREWPLVFVEEEKKLLVIREWPDGSITAYATDEYNDRIGGV